MPPNRFESEVESFLEGSHGDRTHIKRADHHTVTPLCGTLLLSVEDRAAIMAGLEAGLSQVRIARSIGRSPSVVCREIARHRGPGGVYKAQDAGRAAQVARRRPKKRLLDRDEVLRRRVIADLSQGRTPRQISAPPEHGGMWHSGSYG